MTTTPFGFPETAVDRFLREDRQRRELLQSVTGGGAVAEAVRQATAHHQLLRTLDLTEPLRTVRELLDRDREIREALKPMTSTAWALSITETARKVAERDTGLLDMRRHFSSTILDTMRVFEANRGTVAAAIAAASAGDTARRAIAEALPRLSTYSAIAERMRWVDAVTLRASEGEVTSATAIAAEMVIETQRIADAIAATTSDDEGAALLGELFEKIVTYLASLGPKTITELSNMGLIGYTGWLATVLALALTIMAMQPNPSPQDKAAYVELSQKYEALQEESARHHAAEAHADDAYLAGLEKAQLTRSGTLRREPRRDADVVLKADAGMLVGIERREGAWRLVAYHDPLSGQLARAWIYGSVLSARAAPVDIDGE